MEKFLIEVQDKIGYKFNNVDLLKQAFIRKSYSEENGGENNETLEFIGDKALDIAVIKILIEKYSRIIEVENVLTNNIEKFVKIVRNEGELTELKRKIVEKKALSKYMDKLVFNRFLLMGKGDIGQNIQDQDSVKEDLFEAIIGAVTIDSLWDLEVIVKVVKHMIDFNELFDNEDQAVNYVGKLQEWAQKRGYGIPKYTYKLDEIHNIFICNVLVGEVFMGYGEGRSEAKARMNAAENLFGKLAIDTKFNNSIILEVGKPDYLESIKQVNELVQKKIIVNPDYEFYCIIEGGISMWKCEMRVKGINKVFDGKSNGKKEAQKQCAYDLLLYLVENNIG